MSLQREKRNQRWLARNYGSRRGFIRTIGYKLLAYLGVYRRYTDIDWARVERLVFVCKGNICRSVYAEAVAREMGLQAISCGLDTIEDAPANSSAIEVAGRHGIDLSAHRTTPVMYLPLRRTDLLVAMEPWQASYLEQNLYREHQCTLLGLWMKPRLPHIQDPYGASLAYFEKCFDHIRKSIHELDKKVSKKS